MGVVTLRSSAVEVEVDPVRGGKLTSLIDVRTARQWFVVPEQREGPPAGYGASFHEADICGWDEMMPTIDACALSTATGDVELPDHGEVWSVPWEVISRDDEHVSLAVTGRALPYRFERTLRLVGESHLRLDYRLETSASESFPVLWAAHPYVRWLPGCRIEVPSSIERVVDVHPSPQGEVAWDGSLASFLDHAPEGQGRKVWCLPDDRPAEVGVQDADGGALWVTWDPDEVPYLGIWFDARAVSSSRAVAIEPATGYYDDLARAVQLGRAPVVAPHAPLTWSLDLSIRPPR